ncbi:hypothetical protein TSOC_005254 [Tetrabaena socialis]|uniref:Uncharacterized protein n=1 Tax=Tetrabaena socialis TaxID=47790 RepID=A0A2J8A6U4_9CHLO|nr:hypothetical protein TSOC_005254 [Tetrabaena socialis]|eukprot:PNH08249.1 hypothetical protein TSOC_005254 [Tetrabaena socialis]
MHPPTAAALQPPLPYMRPSFFAVVHARRLASYMPAVQHCVGRFMLRLQRYGGGGEAVDLKAEYGGLALAMTGEIAYGVDFWPAEPAEGGEQAKGGGGGGGGGEQAKGGGGGAGSQLMAACKECMTCFELDHATVYLPLQLVRCTLASLLLRYELRLHPRQVLPLRLKTCLTLAAADGVWVTLRELPPPQQQQQQQ